MSDQDVYYFNLLKKLVATTFLKENNAPKLIEEWKGEDIVSFQEDLFEKVKARVSEKWFYTYFKNKVEKLPRIDMLNLLSEYTGFKDWNTFKADNLNKQERKSRFKKSRYWILLIVPFILVLFKINTKNEFHFCFIDDIKNESITRTLLDIKVLQDNESPLYFKTDSLGCFSYKTKNERITFVVQSPYHKTDTIIRSINSNYNQTIKLLTDDYALMLHYYTNGNVKDWKKHKKNLNKLIANDAEIYQLFDDDIGVELFTKEDFIRLLTIPTHNLKRIKVLNKTFKQGEIVKLKFVIR